MSMRKLNVVTCFLSAAGFVLALIALIVRVVNGYPFFPELSMDVLMEDPLVWAVISGLIFVSGYSLLRMNKKDDKSAKK